MFTVVFKLHNGKEPSFRDCESVLHAKQKFEFVYKYWPSDSMVRETRRTREGDYNGYRDGMTETKG